MFASAGGEGEGVAVGEWLVEAASFSVKKIPAGAHAGVAAHRADVGGNVRHAGMGADQQVAAKVFFRVDEAAGVLEAPLGEAVWRGALDVREVVRCGAEEDRLFRHDGLGDLEIDIEREMRQILQERLVKIGKKLVFAGEG